MVMVAATALDLGSVAHNVLLAGTARGRVRPPKSSSRTKKRVSIADRPEAAVARRLVGAKLLTAGTEAAEPHRLPAHARGCPRLRNPAQHEDSRVPYT